jgi:signal transduction histidine kinase
VRVALQHSEEGLTLLIHDNGAGFNMQTRSFGIGLKNIETRALLHDGRLQLQSAPGEGCQLRVSFPLRLTDAIERNSGLKAK